MAPSLTITIPTAQTSPLPKPHTTYTLSITLPLTTYAIQKRYSDFITLDSTLRSAYPSSPPPLPLPPKHYLKNTINNPSLTEERRRGLESYITSILASPDPTLRTSPQLRAFLNLPASATSASSFTSRASQRRSREDELRDPAAWLDHHRDTKAQLRQVRQLLAERDRAEDASTVHSKGGEARGVLADARARVSQLEAAVRELEVGEGEKRRRRDLCRGLVNEVETLVGAVDAAPSRTSHSAALSNSTSASPPSAGTGGSNPKQSLLSSGGPRRVLGAPAPAKETEQTRQLDNAGVLQLQQQVMAEQDEDVKDLTKVVQRMREMGVQINEELVLQNQMLGLVEDDVGRVQGKVDVARRRIGKLK